VLLALFGIKDSHACDSRSEAQKDCLMMSIIAMEVDSFSKITLSNFDLGHPVRIFKD